jgi:hypothetical protein
MIISLLSIYQLGQLGLANYLEPFHDNPTFAIVGLRLAFFPGSPLVVSKKSFVIV